MKSFADLSRARKRSVVITVNGKTMKVKDALKLLSRSLPGKGMALHHYLQMSKAFMSDGREGVDRYVAAIQAEETNKKVVGEVLKTIVE